MSTQGPVDREALYHEVADKVDLTPDEVQEAVRYQFQYVAEVMKEGNFESVRLPYFGIFKVKDGRLEHLNTNQD
jgi:nucleoid DNA-binding protein